MEPTADHTVAKYCAIHITLLFLKCSMYDVFHITLLFLVKQACTQTLLQNTVLLLYDVLHCYF